MGGIPTRLIVGVGLAAAFSGGIGLVAGGQLAAGAVEARSYRDFDAQVVRAQRLRVVGGAAVAGGATLIAGAFGRSRRGRGRRSP